MKRKIISSNYDPIDLLWEYTLFLQKEGYLDTDATSEEPTALDQFMNKKAVELINEEYKVVWSKE